MFFFFFFFHIVLMLFQDSEILILKEYKPRFDILKARHFDSSWNYVRQDALLCTQLTREPIPHPILYILIHISSSCVGVWQNDCVEIIANDQGNRATPSFVSVSHNERLIGDAAKNQVTMNPHNT